MSEQAATELLRRAQRASAEGRADEALRLLIDLVGIDPNSFDALIGLAHVNRQLGRLDESIQAARRALALRPNDAQTHMVLGLALIAVPDLKVALTHFDEAIRLHPAWEQAHLNRASVLQRLGLRHDALQTLKRSRELFPGSIETLIALCQSHLSSGRPGDAVACAEEALKMKPRSGPILVLLSHGLSDQGRLEEAEQALRRAIDVDPGAYQPQYALGILYQQMGRLEESKVYLERSVAIQPRQGAAYYALSRMSTTDSTDQRAVERIEAVLSQAGLALADRAQLHYAAGKLLDDAGKYERAMGHFERGCSANYVSNFGNAPFDRRRYEDAAMRMREIISAEFLEKHRGSGTESELPVFICGMVRSGTTLVEQIVSSHRNVAGAGELEFWYENRWAAVDPSTGFLDRTKLKELAKAYHELLSGIAPAATRVTDKLPGNAGALGIIHLALPNARVLHVTRDPVDTCLSILSTWFPVPPEFAASKADIAFAYRCYLSVIEHWRTILPAHRFMDVPYEELTSKPDEVTRRIIDFLGLEWDDACLAPEGNPRLVKTPSLLQVRRPVSRGSVERWRRYEPWLGPLGGLHTRDV